VPDRCEQAVYPSGHKIDERYLQLWRATLSERITAAAHRLATVLNQSLTNK
jgi:hypothetical protein